jgi:alanine racemase
MYTLSYIQQILGLETSAVQEQELVDIVIDSRAILEGKRSLFVAIKASHRNGHDFIKSAYEKGVRCFLVSEPIASAEFPDAHFIEVKDTLVALQTIAAAIRATQHGPIIGITGSNGKTIVKEWLAYLLEEKCKVYKSPLSYNSQIGVPLSVWKMPQAIDIGIFEAGISKKNEMNRLQDILKPNIGVLTHMGVAHQEGFENQAAKIEEKLQLFSNCNTIIYHSDDEQVDHLMKQQYQDIQLLNWSTKDTNAKVYVEFSKQKTVTEIKLKSNDEVITLPIPFTDDASIENAITCFVALQAITLWDASLIHRFESLPSIAMRLELKKGMHNCSLLSDIYNADSVSLSNALQVLQQQKQHDIKSIILSDIPDVRNQDAILNLIKQLQQCQLHRFVGIGEQLLQHQQLFREQLTVPCYFFENTNAFLQQLQSFRFQNETILLKGSRHFEFEKIVAQLEEFVHQTEMQINLSALKQNWSVYRSHLQPGVKTMAMVKAFSYGSGSFEVANALEHVGVDYLAVAYTDEGIALRTAGISLPIMVMSPDSSSFDRMILWGLEPEIYNLSSFQLFIQALQRTPEKSVGIHIKLDTGMHRLGFTAADLKDLMTALVEHKELKVLSIFSHLAASENIQFDDFTKVQQEQFDMMSGQLIQTLGYTPILHLANSAAISRHPQLHYHMVRLGLGLYGIADDEHMQHQLQEVATLKSRIAQIKTIASGESVGYSRNFVATSPMKIGIINIGYADGYPRNLGNGVAHVLIHNQAAKIIGNICMDLCMIDLTNIESVQEGDEVMLFNKDLPIQQLARWAHTIPYEIMTGISQRVKRVYMEE